MFCTHYLFRICSAWESMRNLRHNIICLRGRVGIWSTLDFHRFPQKLDRDRGNGQRKRFAVVKWGYSVRVLLFLYLSTWKMWATVRNSLILPHDNDRARYRAVRNWQINIGTMIISTFRGTTCRRVGLCSRLNSLTSFRWFSSCFLSLVIPRRINGLDVERQKIVRAQIEAIQNAGKRRVRESLDDTRHNQPWDFIMNYIARLAIMSLSPCEEVYLNCDLHLILIKLLNSKEHDSCHFNK